MRAEDAFCAPSRTPRSGFPRKLKNAPETSVKVQLVEKQILRLKQGFPLLAEPLFLPENITGQRVPSDRPEPAEGGSGGSTTTAPARGVPPGR